MIKPKKFFGEKTNMNENEYKLKLFFGVEIKDNDFIYQHEWDIKSIIIFICQ